MLDLLEKDISKPQMINAVGLSTQEAQSRLSRSGENRLARKKRSSAAKIFAGQFHDIMVIILMAATVISVLLGEYADAIPILLIVIINAFLGFFLVCVPFPADLTNIKRCLFHFLVSF